MKSKIYRCNCRNTWTIQNRKYKKTAGSMLLNGKWYVELKYERKSNPKGFVVTDKSEAIIINPSIELMENYEKINKLIYNKDQVFFNIQEGQYLYFAEDGACYILKPKVLSSIKVYL